MIRSLNSFLQNLIGAPDEGGLNTPSLQLATAALLVEMMGADQTLAAEEAAAIREILATEFALDNAEVDALLEQARHEAREAPGYHPFTSRLNDALDPAQKARLIEQLWVIALADGRICAHENHLMRKLADLLHVSHGDYVAAKARARAARGEG